MATFLCHDQCNTLCKPQKCKESSYWKDKIKKGYPKKWTLKGEALASWSEKEKIELLETLNRLPDSFKAIPFDGFYRMQISGDIGNPATTSQSGREIAIYNRSFNNPFWSLSEVVIHELGHVFYLNMQNDERQNYKDSLGWKTSLSQGNIRKGNFVSSRAKDDAAEDFAENFKYFLLNPEELQIKVPAAHRWILKKTKGNFKLKEGCQSE